MNQSQHSIFSPPSQTINNITINNFGNKVDEKFSVNPETYKPLQAFKQAREAEEEEDSAQEKDNFNFPDGGWECSKCQNYNFRGRKKCHRCNKTKTEEDIDGKPEHMINPKKKGKTEKKKDKCPNGKTGTRVGDWICQRCCNHNFSFRSVCNMCYLSQVESNRMLYAL